jgi:AbrB family looped-hinge helix DNA binding protein
MPTVTLSTTGQVVIPKEIRDALHWEVGAELTLTEVGNGILLKAVPKKRGKRLEDLIGMLQARWAAYFRLRSCASRWITAPTGKNPRNAADSSRQHWRRGNRALPGSADIADLMPCPR